MKLQKIELKESCAEITAEMAMIDNSTFTNVSMKGISISDANLSDLKIAGAQMGGALIQDIGMPAPDHPNYEPGLPHRPVTFKTCDLNNSTFTDCDLSHARIENCNISGLTINGILVEMLLNQMQRE